MFSNENAYRILFLIFIERHSCHVYTLHRSSFMLFNLLRFFSSLFFFFACVYTYLECTTTKVLAIPLRAFTTNTEDLNRYQRDCVKEDASNYKMVALAFTFARRWMTDYWNGSIKKNSKTRWKKNHTIHVNGSSTIYFIYW